MTEFVQVLSHGIHVVDTGYVRPRFDAAYLVVERGRAAFIDTGTRHAVPRLLQALADAGLAPEAVDYVIPTHVHLDHAGGAGTLMRALPNATLVVHPRGAPHLIDPAKLEAGARAVYGDAEFDRSYGVIDPVDAARVRRSHDGLVIELAGRPLRFLDTPGHAKHHHAVWDAASRGCFTGDTFGLSYREFDTGRGPWLLPTTTPVQFEPAALRLSVERIHALHPAQVLLTHYGAVGDVQRLGREMLVQLDAMVAIGQRLRAAPARHAALREALFEEAFARVQAHGCRFDAAQVREMLAMDFELNAQGLGVWLDREEKTG
jgi:glyoxylase-like metal-dependent hydrolase (beta-lactamase superfamily II)